MALEEDIQESLREKVEDRMEDIIYSVYDQIGLKKEPECNISFSINISPNEWKYDWGYSELSFYRDRDDKYYASLRYFDDNGEFSVFFSVDTDSVDRLLMFGSHSADQGGVRWYRETFYDIPSSLWSGISRPENEDEEEICL